MLNIFVYVDGSDLTDVEADLSRAFIDYASNHTSLCAKFISRRHPRTADLDPEDLAQWDLGINLTTLALSETEATELVAFLVSLSNRTGRAFWIGQWQPEKGISEDLILVDSTSTPDESKQLLVMLQ
jgi:hypothetical protein